MEGYCELAQKITIQLRNDSVGTEGDSRQDGNADKAEGPAEVHLAEVHQHAVEIQEIHLQRRECKVHNIMRAAKIQRLGEHHVQRAKVVTGKAKAEVTQAIKAH